MTPQEHLNYGASPEEVENLTRRMMLLQPQHGIVTCDRRMLDAISKCVNIRNKTDQRHSVLIVGPSGCGKELFANLLTRQGLPRVYVNVASLPDTLVQSILFGYTKGSFTGASDKDKAGAIETAGGGVCFLDEIGDMPLSQQPALLPVLERNTRRFTPIGAPTHKTVLCRIVAATNVDVTDPAKFRADLLGRFSYIIRIPGLIDRPNDAALIAESLGLSAARLSGIPPEDIERYGVRALQRAADEALLD